MSENLADAATTQNRNGNQVYTLTLPTGEEVVLTWMADGSRRLRLRGPQHAPVAISEMYPGKPGERMTRIIMTLQHPESPQD